MKLRSWSLFLALALFGYTVGWAETTKVELYLSAAVSLKEVLTELQSAYQKRRPEVKILLNRAASDPLQSQIEQGAPADLFIPAAPWQMDALEQKGLVQSATRRDLAENRLVLVVPQDSKLSLKSFKDLTAAAVKKIGMGAPDSVPAGRYALEVLERLKIVSKLRAKLVLGSNVRTVLTYVETGNVDAGIVYRTDAVGSDRVKIIALAPRGLHQPIVYPAAVLASAGQPKAAGELLRFLTGREARRCFVKYGFIPLGKENGN